MSSCRIESINSGNDFSPFCSNRDSSLEVASSGWLLVFLPLAFAAVLVALAALVALASFLGSSALAALLRRVLLGLSEAALVS